LTPADDVVEFKSSATTNTKESDMTLKMWTTGKVKDKSIRATHHTEAEAVAWIDEQKATDPEGVARGDYYIDPPAAICDLAVADDTHQ
jgi:hypothetical protein